MFGECKLEEILPFDAYPIRASYGSQYYYKFTSQGKYFNNSKAECIIFPFKGNRDWSTFKAPWVHKHFEAYQKVLVAADDYSDTAKGGKIWCADLYGHYDSERKIHYCVGHSEFTDDEIIPYESNEDKLGKPVE